MERFLNEKLQRVEVLKEITVLARNFPTEDKPHTIRLHFETGFMDIEVNGRGYYGDFTYFLNVQEGNNEAETG